MAISDGGSLPGYEPYQANNGVGEAQNCLIFSWVHAGGAPGSSWMSLTWSSPKTVSWIAIDTHQSTLDSCGVLGRALGGATVQYWDGAAWVAIGTVSGKTNDWSYVFPAPVTTTAIRLYGVYAIGGQNQNPIIYEWRVMGY